MDRVGVGLSKPPIHDIQTDWSRPIVPPEKLVEARQENGWNLMLEAPTVPENALGREPPMSCDSVWFSSLFPCACAGFWPDMVGKPVSQLQRSHYENIKPLLIRFPPEVVLEFAEGIAIKQGWDIASVDQENGLIHATHTSFWFGFTDDILIRVTAQGPQGTRIDVRSTSRVGLSDLGANAQRIKGFIDDAALAVRQLEVQP